MLQRNCWLQNNAFETQRNHLELCALCFPHDQSASSPPCRKGSSYLTKTGNSYTHTKLDTIWRRQLYTLTALPLWKEALVFTEKQAVWATQPVREYSRTKQKSFPYHNQTPDHPTHSPHRLVNIPTVTFSFQHSNSVNYYGLLMMGDKALLPNLFISSE